MPESVRASIVFQPVGVIEASENSRLALRSAVVAALSKIPEESGSSYKGLLAEAHISNPPAPVVQGGAGLPSIGTGYRIKSTMVDAFGNKTVSYSKQTFVVLFGQAKLKTSTSASVTTSIDGSKTVRLPYTTTYSYFGEPGYTVNPAAGHYEGLLAAAGIVSGQSYSPANPVDGGTLPGTPFKIKSVMTDAFGNITESYSNQTFVVLFGQAKLKTTEAASVSKSTDGSRTVTLPYTTTYSYFGEPGYAVNPGAGHFAGLMAAAIITSAPVD